MANITRQGNSILVEHANKFEWFPAEDITVLTQGDKITVNSKTTHQPLITFSFDQVTEPQGATTAQEWVGLLVSSGTLFNPALAKALNLQQLLIDTGYTANMQAATGYSYRAGSNLKRDVAVAYPFIIDQGISFTDILIKFRGGAGSNNIIHGLYSAGHIGTGDLYVPHKKLIEFDPVNGVPNSGTRIVHQDLNGINLRSGLYYWVKNTSNGQGRLESIASQYGRYAFPSGYSGVGSGGVWKMEQNRAYSLGLPDEFTTPWTNKVTSNGNLDLLFFKNRNIFFPPIP